MEEEHQRDEAAVECQRDEAAAGRQIVAGHGKTLFAHICLYNSLHNSGKTKDGIEALGTMYANLLSLHGYVVLRF